MKKTIVLRVPEDLAETLRLSAVGDRRSVNQQAIYLLQRALVADGWLRPATYDKLRPHKPPGL